MSSSSPRTAASVISIVFATFFVPAVVSAQTPPALAGVYNGTYRCTQGATNLKLSLTVTGGGELSALFTFYLPPGTQNQGYTYSLHGQYDGRTAKFSLMPARWETQHPANFTMVGMNGTFDSNELTGTISGAGCSTFNLERNQSESANIAAVMALQKSVAPAEAGAAPAPGSYEAALRAQAPASARAALQTPPPQSQPAAATPSRTPAPQSASRAATGDTSQTGATRGRTSPAPDASTAGGGTPSRPSLAQAKRDTAAVIAEITSPILRWGLKSEKDALTDEVTTKPTTMTFIPGADGKLQGSVQANAYCGTNGVSVFFIVSGGDKDSPSFPWYSDNSRPDDAIADVRIRVDSRAVHVAQGFPQVNGRARYSNTLGLLFYEPGTFRRAVRDQQDSVTTGIPAFDGLVGGFVREAARENARAWQDSAAGPLADLVNARSIRIELPVTNFNPKPVLDLNPQDPVLHKLVADCNATFTGTGR
jgi:hypothetical protein